jgi:hypothetical protein
MKAAAKPKQDHVGLEKVHRLEEDFSNNSKKSAISFGQVQQ